MSRIARELRRARADDASWRRANGRAQRWDAGWAEALYAALYLMLVALRCLGPEDGR